MTKGLSSIFVQPRTAGRFAQCAALSVVLSLPIVLAACNGGGILGLPSGQISAVQLNDQPAFTVAFSVTSAVANPSAVTKVNWVFGDGSGFVEGPANQTTISYKYAAPGTYQVSAYIFTGGGLLSQINGSVVVTGSGGSGSGGGSAPGKVTGLTPADKATNVAVLTKLNWSSASSATSYDVYLGIDLNAVTNADNSDATNFKGNQTTTNFDPQGLAPDTQYYIRVDAVNAVGLTKGTVQTFHTAMAPTKSKNFVPVDQSISARIDQVLKWVAGQHTTSHDVYFGKDQNAVTNADNKTVGVFKGNQTTLSFDPDDPDSTLPGLLLSNTTYYWRIDEVGLGGTTTGDVLTFTTKPTPPQVTSPVPADTSTNINIATTLAWSAVASTESFDVYLGVDQLDVEFADHNSPQFQGNQTTKLFTPTTALLPSQTYYWRIDPIDGGGTTAGTVFSFTTSNAPGAVVGAFTPANNAQNANINQTLMWSVGGGGATQTFRIFFSSTQSDVVNGAAGANKGTQDVSATQFDLVTLLNPATQYYWRIDSIGPGGTTNGPILTFTTGALPSPTDNPIPANNARGVSAGVTLQWTPGVGATSNDVYFGTDQTAVTNAGKTDAQFQGNQVGNSFTPVTLLNTNTDYFWRVDAVSPGGPRKGTVWKFTTGPGQAVNPVPANAAVDIDLNTSLTWSAGTGATQHDVYFGTSSSAVNTATPATAVIYRGRQGSSTFNPGALTAVTPYFWRIDEVNSNGDVTKGAVWTFTTVLGQATNPNPADVATDVDLNTFLEWTASTGATTHDVYFGTNLANVTNATTASAEFKGNQSATLFSPGPLSANTIYFWRIDEVAADNVTKKKGNVWRFTTLKPPLQASNPNPLNNATGIAVSVTLSWAAVGSATSYDVYFGTNQGAVAAANTSSGEFQGNQAITSFNPSGLAATTAYFWRIDTKNAAGTTTGVVWKFTTQ